MPAPLILRIIGDATSVLKTNDAVIASNTRVGKSAIDMGADFEKSAAAEIAAGTKSIQIQRARVEAITAAQAKLVKGSDAYVASQVALDGAQAKLNRSLGLTAVATSGAGRGAQDAEKDFNKMARGALAGSGVISGLGRSLAFASTGFLGFAVGATLITRSISGAEELTKAQQSLAVALQHTGGNLAQLEPHYEATARAAAQFGVTETDATIGLARATELTGNAAAAQRAYQEALVISKATGKDFNSVLTATARGQEGIVTSLRRYGILVDKTTPGTEQLAEVMKRFGGQAAANTTSIDRLHASLSNALDTIGVELLPTVNRLADSFANWLTKLNDSGKLQADVNKTMKVTHDVASPLAKTFGAAADGAQHLANGLKSIYDAARGLNSSVGAAFHQIGGVFGIGGGAAGIQLPSALVRPSAFFPSGLTPSRGGSTAGPFGSAQPMTQYWKQFELGFKLQMAELQAALTKSNTDDVAVAKAVVARIKKQIDEGVLHGPALDQALQTEASALTTIWSAEEQAAQKRAAAAAAAKAKIISEIQNAIDPIRLEVALSKAESLGQDIVPALKDLLAAAYKGLAKAIAANNQQLEKQAYDQITSLKQQIKDAETNAVAPFQVSAKLALSLAHDQALGGDVTKDLEKERTALLHYIATHKKNIAAETDAYNQLAAINEQLTSSITSAYGDYKKASLKAETAGLGLTRDQRERLQARLSQRGPGGTTPETGTGAAGYVIDPATGRPVKVKGGHGHGGRVPASVGGGGGGGGMYREQITIVLNIDGKQVTRVVTRGQQRYRRSNPSSRRGPHAATATA